MSETEQKWLERVREWRCSGLSASEYARWRGFAEATLRWWSSRLVREMSTGLAVAPKPAVRMARVTAIARPTPSSLTVRVGAAQVEVQPGFDRILLRELVEALGGES